jgi:homoserine kinase
MLNMDWIKVFAPATIGNIGPGFDVLGLAVSGWGDVIEARKIDSGILISEIDSEHDLPTDPDKNTAGIAAREVLRLLGEKGGVEMKITKGLPSGSGLGSSAASAAAAAFAVNFLYGEMLTREDLILPATKAEEYVSGGFFADNTAPCLLGGATLTRSKLPLDVTKIGHIDKLCIVLVTPDVVILTREAREILPKTIPMEGFVNNMANSCLISAAFAKNDYDLFARSLNDVVVEPVRATLIRGFEEVKENALRAGADGVAISGSGPTLFAITNHEKNRSYLIEDALVRSFKKNGIQCKSIITGVDMEGTRLIE